MNGQKPVPSLEWHINTIIQKISLIFLQDASLNQDFFNNSTVLRGPSSTFSLKSISPFQNQSRKNNG